MQLNRIVLIGRLTRDPEERFSADGVEISKFAVAVNRRGSSGDRERGERDADFFNVVCFRQSAKFANQYLRRGQLVAVEGRCQIDEYTDRDGNRRTWVEVLADNVQNLTPRGEGDGGGGGGGGRWEHDRGGERSGAERGSGGAERPERGPDRDFADDEEPRSRAPRGERSGGGERSGSGERPAGGERDAGGERPPRRQTFGPRDADQADPFAEGSPAPPPRGGAPSRPPGGNFDADDADPFADE